MLDASHLDQQPADEPDAGTPVSLVWPVYFLARTSAGGKVAWGRRRPFSACVNLPGSFGRRPALIAGRKRGSAASRVQESTLPRARAPGAGALFAVGLMQRLLHAATSGNAGKCYSRQLAARSPIVSFLYAFLVAVESVTQGRGLVY